MISKSTLHPLARFVTREAISLLLKRQPEQIYRIDCWRRVIHVVAEGISTFVSYADIPPILGVDPPSDIDFAYWHRRWKKNNEKLAPEFWVEFYARKFQQSVSVRDLFNWGKLIGMVKSAFAAESLQGLRNFYAKEKWAWDNF